jgi:hypothetical protein
VTGRRALARDTIGDAQVRHMNKPEPYLFETAASRRGAILSTKASAPPAVGMAPSRPRHGVASRCGRWCRGVLLAVAGLCAGTAQASTGELQILFTMMLDFERHVPKTVEGCERVDPAAGAEARAAYETFREEQLPYQAKVREAFTRVFQQRPDGAGVLAMVEASLPQLVDMHFPQEVTVQNRALCRAVLIPALKGQTLMVNFKDYADKIDRYPPQPASAP